MLISTEGIVLKAVPYSDSKTMLTVYTELRGILSFVLRGGRKSKVNTYKEGLSTVEITYLDSPGRDVFSIRTIAHALVYSGLYTDFDKRSIAMFINEVIFKSIHEVEANPEMYHFLRSSINTLDKTGSPSNFHLFFLVHFSTHLGFFPRINSEDRWFDLKEGMSSDRQPDHALKISGETKKGLEALCLSTDYQSASVPPPERHHILHALVQYYRCHIAGFGIPKSLDVLEVLYLDL